jgi:hypothetical protein
VTRTGLTGTASRRYKELLNVLVGPEKGPTDLSPLDLSQVNNYYKHEGISKAKTSLCRNT